MSQPARSGGWEDSGAGVTGLVSIPAQSRCQTTLLQPRGCSPGASSGHSSSKVSAPHTSLGSLQSKAGPHRQGSRFPWMKGPVLAHGQWKAGRAHQPAGKNMYQRWVQLQVSLGDQPNSSATVMRWVSPQGQVQGQRSFASASSHVCTGSVHRTALGMIGCYRLACSRGAVQKNYSHGRSLLLSQVALKGSGKSQRGSPVLQLILLGHQKES